MAGLLAMAGLECIAKFTRFTIRAPLDYAYPMTSQDHCNDTICFAGDVDAILGYGFDSVKLDGCGQEENVELWSEMLAWTLAQDYKGKTKGGAPGVLIENCHNGPNVPTRSPTQGDWCPFNYYRSSTDIRPVYGSILVNLNSIPQLAASNLSWPGCWCVAMPVRDVIIGDKATLVYRLAAVVDLWAWAIPRMLAGRGCAFVAMNAAYQHLAFTFVINVITTSQSPSLSSPSPAGRTPTCSRWA